VARYKNVTAISRPGHSVTWLRHYATSRKVTVSIPDEVIGFFNRPNASSRTMALGLTQLLTEMSTRNLLGGKGRPARKAENFTAICEPIVYKMWEPRRLTTLWTSTACYRDSFTFFFSLTAFHSSIVIRKPLRPSPAVPSDTNSLPQHISIGYFLSRSCYGLSRNNFPASYPMNNLSLRGGGMLQCCL
jgi:hypothetical protein